MRWPIRGLLYRESVISSSLNICSGEHFSDGFRRVFSRAAAFNRTVVNTSFALTFDWRLLASTEVLSSAFTKIRKLPVSAAQHQYSKSLRELVVVNQFPGWSWNRIRLRTTEQPPFRLLAKSEVYSASMNKQRQSRGRSGFSPDKRFL